MRLYSAPPLLATGASGGGDPYWSSVKGLWNLQVSLANQATTGSSYDMTLSGATRDDTDGVSITSGDYCRTSSNAAALMAGDGVDCAYEIWFEIDSPGTGTQNLMACWDNAGDNRCVLFQHQAAAFRALVYQSGTPTPVTDGSNSITWGSGRYFAGWYRDDSANTAYFHAGPVGSVSYLGSVTYNYGPAKRDEPFYLGGTQLLTNGLTGSMQAARVTIGSNRGVTSGTITPDSLPLPTS